MRLIFKLITCIIGFLLITTCSNDENEINYIKINGKTFPLRYGFIEDNGTDINIKYRIFDIEFTDNEINPSTYIQFRILSYKTTNLETGTYTYNYYANQKGELTFLSIGTNIKYDNKNVRIAGNVYNDNYWDFYGNIIVGFNKYKNYTFDIYFKGYNLDTNDSIVVEGYFEKNLTQNVEVLLDSEK